MKINTTKGFGIYIIAIAFFTMISVGLKIEFTNIVLALNYIFLLVGSMFCSCENDNNNI